MVTEVTSRADGQVFVRRARDQPPFGLGRADSMTIRGTDSWPAPWWLRRPRSVLAPSSRGSETILVVEDEPMVRSIVRRMLEDRGYLVMDASSGQEAIDTIGRAHVRIAFLIERVTE